MSWWKAIAKFSKLRVFLISVLLLILLAAWLSVRYLIMRHDRPVLLPAYQLLMQKNEYVGKSVGVIGYLAGDGNFTPPTEFQLFPIKDFADFAYDERLMLSIRVEYPNLQGDVTLPEDCLNRYVKVYGEFGESVLGFLPAIHVDFIIRVDEDEKENGICQPIIVGMSKENKGDENKGDVSR